MQLALAEGLYIAEVGRPGWGTVATLNSAQHRSLQVSKEICGVAVWNDGEYWAPPLMPARSVRLLTQEEATRIVESATSVAIKRLWRMVFRIDGALLPKPDLNQLLDAARHAATVYERHRLPHRLRKAKEMLRS